MLIAGIWNIHTIYWLGTNRH